MGKWDKYKLINVCNKIGSGATPRGGDASYIMQGISLIRSQNILDFTFSKDSLAFISELQAKELSNVEVKERDVLINITGDSVARVCQVPKDVLPARVNQHVAILRADRNKVNPDFLKYYLLANPIKQLLLTYASTGATRKALTKGMLEQTEVDIPDIKTQTRIASILSSLDDKIELNRRMNQTLEQMAQALFNHYFVDDVDPNDLPEGWRWGRLDEIAQNHDSKRIPLSSRQRDERKGNFPYYGAASLMGYVDAYIFDGLYILLGEDGTVIDDKGYPVLQYIWGRFWVNNHAHVLQGKSYFSTNHLYLVLKNIQVNHLVTGAVDRSIQSEEVADVFEMAGIERFDISIINDDFLATGKEQKSGNELKLELIRQILEDEIKVRSYKNIVKSKKLKDEVDKIIKGYHEHFFDSLVALEKMREVAKEYQDEDIRRKQLGLTEEEEAFYEILAHHKTALQDFELIKELVKEITIVIKKNLKVDWYKKQDLVAMIKKSVKQTLIKKGVLQELQEILDEIMEQVNARYREWEEVAA